MERFDLEQGTKRCTTNGTIGGLVAQRVRTTVAQAQMSTREDEGVSHVAHADDALGTIVFGVLVASLLLQISNFYTPVKKICKLYFAI